MKAKLILPLIAAALIATSCGSGDPRQQQTDSAMAMKVRVDSAIAAGQRRFTAIAIAADSVAWPCGICRQVLREFACGPEMPIMAGAAGSGSFETRTLEELLPGSFGPEYLLNDQQA